jgi:hypothetical protein
MTITRGLAIQKIPANIFATAHTPKSVTRNLNRIPFKVNTDAYKVGDMEQTSYPSAPVLHLWLVKAAGDAGMSEAMAEVLR